MNFIRIFTVVTLTAVPLHGQDPARVVAKFANPIVQLAGRGGGQTTFTMMNIGGRATTITLSRIDPPQGQIFTQSPTNFSLAPGAMQIVTVTGLAQPAGFYPAISIPTGEGIPTVPGPAPSGLPIPIQILSVVRPFGRVTAEPATSRVDVAAAAGDAIVGAVTFTNNGTAPVTGIAASDVAWIIPYEGPLTIAAGSSVAVTFRVQREGRPDAGALAGSVEGNLSFWFLNEEGQSFGKIASDSPPPTPSVSIVRVVDTVQTPVTVAGVPPLAAGEVALFIPGVRHASDIGGSGSASDISLFKSLDTISEREVKMYYTASATGPSSARSTSLPLASGRVSVAVADVVKNMFNGNDQLGTVQIRSKEAEKLAVVANIRRNGPHGTFGSSIPVFRSDRSIGVNDQLVLAGVLKNDAFGTTIFIQETAGLSATIRIDFLSADGAPVSSRIASIEPFRLLQLSDAVPLGAVTAVVVNTSPSGGKISAYATPIDEVSGDMWSISDWAKQLGYASDVATVIPVAGRVHGANRTFFRTDVAIANRGSAPARGVLTYVSRNGVPMEREISLAALQTAVIGDVLATKFEVAGDAIGYLTFAPANGHFAISSRTFSTVDGAPASFGTGVPAVAAVTAARMGTVVPMAGLSDASRATVVTGRRGTFRTNFALMETAGEMITVRVTLRFILSVGGTSQARASASRDYILGGGHFILLNSIAGEIIGGNRLALGDLANLEADFHVISGNGSLFVFTSTVENATGDATFRMP